MNLVLEKAARKGLDRMTSKTAGAMLERLEAVAAAPDPKHTNVKPLSGARDAFRLRQGNWRAVYVLDRVDVRGSVYR